VSICKCASTYTPCNIVKYANKTVCHIRFRLRVCAATTQYLFFFIHCWFAFCMAINKALKKSAEIKKSYPAQKHNIISMLKKRFPSAHDSSRSLILSRTRVCVLKRQPHRDNNIYRVRSPPNKSYNVSRLDDDESTIIMIL